jgi:hypothetical protein
MTDNLSDFADEELSTAAEGNLVQETIVRELLIFECGSSRLAVSALLVDSVVAWKRPVTVPGSDSRVRGVIQDRGRVVVIMAHADGGATEAVAGEYKRIVICVTPRGLVGLPASGTSSVGSVELSGEPTPGTVYDSPKGPFLYVDPSAGVLAPKDSAVQPAGQNHVEARLADSTSELERRHGSSDSIPGQVVQAAAGAATSLSPEHS